METREILLQNRSGTRLAQIVGTRTERGQQRSKLVPRSSKLAHSAAIWANFRPNSDKIVTKLADVEPVLVDMLVIVPKVGRVVFGFAQFGAGPV